MLNTKAGLLLVLETFQPKTIGKDPFGKNPLNFAVGILSKGDSAVETKTSLQHRSFRCHKYIAVIPYRMGKVSYKWISSSGFELLLWARYVVKTRLKYGHRLADCVEETYLKACRMYSTIIFLISYQ